MTPSLVRMISGEPALAHCTAHSRLNFVAVASLFWMGHEMSRTKPSIVEGGVASGFVASVCCAGVDDEKE